MNNRYLGSNFDEFLIEEGLFAEVEAVALKRLLAFQLQQAMERFPLSKTDMALKMKTSRAALDRLLDPENTSITLLTIARAAIAIGKKVNISFE